MYLTAAVHHVHSTDHIIALGSKGNVIEQGTFAELDSTDGYMKSLAIAAAKKEQDQPSEEGDEDEGNSERALTTIAAPQNSDLGDDARRLGDLSVWNYYRKALTLWRLLLFVSLEALCVPSLRFIRMCLYSDELMPMLTVVQRSWLVGGQLRTDDTLTCSSASLSSCLPWHSCFKWDTFS